MGFLLTMMVSKPTFTATMWGRLINPHFTNEKTETQRNLYLAQGHITIKCQSQVQNLDLPDSWSIGPFSNNTAHKSTLGRIAHGCYPVMMSAANLRPLPCARHSREALPCFKHGTLGLINDCGTRKPGWVAPGPSMEWMETAAGGSYATCRSSRQKNVLSGHQAWKKLECPRDDKQSVKEPSQ